jgi:hypothetical protein
MFTGADHDHEPDWACALPKPDTTDKARTDNAIKDALATLDAARQRRPRTIDRSSDCRAFAGDSMRTRTCSQLVAQPLLSHPRSRQRGPPVLARAAQRLRGLVRRR